MIRLVMLSLRITAINTEFQILSWERQYLMAVFQDNPSQPEMNGLSKKKKSQLVAGGFSHERCSRKQQEISRFCFF
jgi:hypothetical protein